MRITRLHPKHRPAKVVYAHINRVPYQDFAVLVNNIRPCLHKSKYAVVVVDYTPNPFKLAYEWIEYLIQTLRTVLFDAVDFKSFNVESNDPARGQASIRLTLTTSKYINVSEQAGPVDFIDPTAHDVTVLMDLSMSPSAPDIRIVTTSDSSHRTVLREVRRCQRIGANQFNIQFDGK